MEPLGELNLQRNTFTDSLQIANALFFVLASNLIDKAMDDSIGKLYIEKLDELRLVKEVLIK